MLKFGKVSEVDPNKGLARVEFADDEIVSDWLPVMQQKTFKDKSGFPLDINEHVVCLMDEFLENGVVLGSIYSEVDTPGIAKGDVYGIDYGNGDQQTYDRQQKRARQTTGPTEIASSPAGPTVKKAGESLKTILSDIMDAVIAETHATAVGPSGPPLNAAQYIAIKTRILAFFEA